MLRSRISFWLYYNMYIYLHRYLYVNCRQWPKNYSIENPFYPPPIAQEIDIHVIDLMKMKRVGTMHQAHKAYTSNDECFFIFLDVSNEYVARYLSFLREIFSHNCTVWWTSIQIMFTRESFLSLEENLFLSLQENLFFIIN